jgi:hypothetical protein
MLTSASSSVIGNNGGLTLSSLAVDEIDYDDFLPLPMLEHFFYPPARPNKARHPTGWADVSDLPFSNSNLYSALDAPPRPSGGCA